MADQYNSFGEKVVKPDDPNVIKAALKAKPAAPAPSTSSVPAPQGSGGSSLGDAINSAIGSAAKLAAPQSIVQRKQKIDQDVGKALGDEF